MKVLVFCLYKRLYKAAQDSIHALQWDQPLDVLFLHGPPQGKRGQAIAAGQREGQRLFLHGDWDALLMVESDMIYPPDALRKLAALEVDIAYGLYCSRWRYKWLLTIGDVRGEPRGYLSDNPRQAAQAWGRTIDVTGKGTGITLLRRKVVEQARFECRDHHFSDHWLAAQALQHGWRQRADLSVMCGHITHKDYEDAERVVYPRDTFPFYETFKGEYD